MADSVARILAAVHRLGDTSCLVGVLGIGRRRTLFRTASLLHRVERRNHGALNKGRAGRAGPA
jgi:hypothetical protein